MAGLQALGPVEEGARLRALDVLRGVAILGILLMNIPVMGMIGERHMPPLPAVANADWAVWLVQDTVFSGAMRGLFTLLIGAGMLLMLGRQQDEEARVQAYFVRCFALIILGFANFALFLWPGEILFAYGTVGLALFLFRKAGQRLLWTASIALILMMMVGLITPRLDRLDLLREAPAAVAAKAEGKALSERQTEAVTLFEKATASNHPKPEAIERERVQRTSFPGVLSWSGATWVWYNLNFPSFMYSFETLSLMLMGMALYRNGVLTGEKSLGFYLKLAFWGFVIGVGLRSGYNLVGWRAGFEVNPDYSLAFGLLFEPSRIGLTLGYVGLVLSLCKLGLFKGLQGALQAVGRLSLTNYVVQSIITSMIFYGLGLLGRFSFAELMLLCVPIWISQMIFSLMWLKIFTMGPLEWLFRVITYGQRLPLLKPRTVRNEPLGGATTVS